MQVGVAKKFAPRLRARAIWKPKPLKHQVLGTFFEVQPPFVDLKRVRNDAFRVAGAGISCSVMSMFEGSDAESAERLPILCYRHVTLRGSFHVAVSYRSSYASAQLFSGRRSTFEAST